jgi:hypothetical protein
VNVEQTLSDRNQAIIERRQSQLDMGQFDRANRHSLARHHRNREESARERATTMLVRATKVVQRAWMVPARDMREQSIL